MPAKSETSTLLISPEFEGIKTDHDHDRDPDPALLISPQIQRD